MTSLAYFSGLRRFPPVFMSFCFVITPEVVPDLPGRSLVESGRAFADRRAEGASCNREMCHANLTIFEEPIRCDEHVLLIFSTSRIILLAYFDPYRLMIDTFDFGKPALIQFSRTKHGVFNLSKHICGQAIYC